MYIYVFMYIILIILIYHYLFNFIESFRNLNTNTKIDLGRRIQKIPALDPEMYYKTLYADRDYIIGDLIQNKSLKLNDNKQDNISNLKTNAEKRLDKNVWSIYAISDIKLGDKIIIK